MNDYKIIDLAPDDTFTFTTDNDIIKFIKNKDNFQYKFTTIIPTEIILNLNIKSHIENTCKSIENYLRKLGTNKDNYIIVAKKIINVNEVEIGICSFPSNLFKIDKFMN